MVQCKLPGLTLSHPLYCFYCVCFPACKGSNHLKQHEATLSHLLCHSGSVALLLGRAKAALLEGRGTNRVIVESTLTCCAILAMLLFFLPGAKPALLEARGSDAGQLAGLQLPEPCPCSCFLSCLAGCCADCLYHLSTCMV